jgi:hypothetical protein
MRDFARKGAAERRESLMYKPLVLLVAVLCVSCTARTTSQPPTAEPPAVSEAEPLPQQPPVEQLPCSTSPKENEHPEELDAGLAEEEPLPPEEPPFDQDPQVLKDARVRAEKLGVPQSVLHMLDRDYYGRPALEVTRLTAISDAVEAALARNVKAGVIKTLLELAADDDWSDHKIVEELGELRPSPDNP